MSKEIHVINKVVGGVGEISKAISRDCVVVKTDDFFYFLKSRRSKEEYSFYFHQPKSHLYCVLFCIYFWNLRKKTFCILHEASNYNLGTDKLLRALLGFIVRFFCVSFLRLIGVKILGVSKYVGKSYGINDVDLISYLHLFRSELIDLIFENEKSKSLTEKNVLAVWLRKGGGKDAIGVIKKLISLGLIKKAYVLGDSTSVDEVRSFLEENNVYVPNVGYKVASIDFKKILCEATWFISLFKREGFGLSLFQALCAGCVCLTSRSGAIPEWMPEKNFSFFERIDKNPSVDIYAEVDLICRSNLMFAKEYLNYEV